MHRRQDRISSCTADSTCVCSWQGCLQHWTLTDSALKQEHTGADFRSGLPGLICYFAAAALTKPQEFGGKELNIAVENLDIKDMARILSQAVGVNIEAVNPTFEDGKAVGVTSPAAPYQQWVNEVNAAVDVDAVKAYGFPLSTLEQCIAENAQELRKSLGG